MSLIAFTENLIVGIQQIDEQHRNLVSVLNQLHQAVTEGKDKDVLQQLLKSLIAHTVVHFRDEEEYMRKFKYVGYPLHKKEHDALMTEVIDFQKRMEADQAVFTSDLTKFLSAWLKRHIVGTDMVLPRGSGWGSTLESSG